MTADQIYPIFNQSGLNYGPSHQCLVGLKPDAQRVVAQLRRDDQDTFAAGAIDMEPGLFDAALQASIGFSLSPGSGDAGLMLPFAIEEVSVFAPVPRRVWVTLDRRAADTPVRGVQKLDIDLIDEDGIVVARIKGFSMRTLPMPNLGDHHADTPEAPTEAAYFKALLANSLDCAPDEIDMDEPFEHYGIDSHMVMELTSKLETRFGTLPKTLFFEYETLRDLIDYFEQNHTDAMRNTRASDAKDIKHAIGAQRPARSDHRRTDIAIIGLSGRYPQAYDIAAFWENLKNGRDCITEIPKDRWDWQKYFTEDRSRLDGHYSKWGGFIDDVAAFDPLFFNISPSAAEAMDPQERLFLEHAWMAMEDAGYTRSDFQAQSHGDDGAQIGVYAGVMYGEYQLFGAEQPPGSNTASYYAGIANRVSYAFNLNGPSMAVDTMCSSSLTALHLACADLALGRTDMAFAGGVNLNLHPNKYGLLSMGQYISGSGRCQSFGVDGDGYVPSEGVGVVLLKPLNKAISDGDHIYGVIKSSAVNHGGRTNGYSVPNPKAQQSVISRALQETGLDPRQIGYIEAHGTGTKLGDPIEILGLTRGYGNELQTPCWIGSSKSNIGHGEAVSGLAGLTKVLLQIKSGKIAPSLHAETLNPDIDFDATPFTVNTRLRDWPKPKIDGLDRARAAGISSFGAGGSNAHIIVEEYEAETHHADQTPEPHLLVLSAQSKDQLRQQAQNLFNWLQEPQRSAPLRDIAFTLQIGREAMPYRLGVIVSSAQDLGRELGAYLAERPHQVGEGRAKVVAKPDIADPDAGDLNAVLDGWLRGTVYDFRKLYGSGPQPRRVSLPTYPFARETYWPSFARPPETAARIASEPSHDLLILEPEWTLEPLRDQSRTTVTEHRAVFLGQDPALEGIETVSLATTGEDSATGFEEHALALMADLQACARSKRTGDLVYQLVIDPDKDPSEAAALAGMIDTAAQELRGVFGQTIEVDTAQPGLAELLVKEGARSTVTRIRYVDGQRSVLRWRETCPPLNPTPVWREGGTYLITGGAGGIGKHVARHIATSLSSVKLVLVGRSQSTREHTEFLDELRALGAHAEYHALDLSDQGAVETFIKTLVTHQPLHGVLHSAGILSDGLLRSKRPDDLRRVFAPKVAGLANLDRALSGVDLDFFALFSSIAGAMGNPGQADYAAANAYLDAFAQTRKSRHAAKGHTVSIAWPYWADGGMTLDTASTEKMFEASGIAPLSTRSALLALDGILATSLTHALVLEGDGAKMRALIAPDAEASPRARPELTRSEPTVSDPGAPNKSLEREIEAFLTDELASLLRISRDRLEPDVPFVDYGVDSVAIMAFSEKIEKISGPLPATLFFEYPTLETAARELAQSFGPAFATHLGASANAADATPASVAGKPMDAPERPAAAPVHAAPVMMRAENPASDDIAIIGLSGRFPEADTLDVFWDNLIHGRNCITEFPTSRWDHFSSEDQASLTDACKWGGFLSDIDCFDAQFFNITPTEAELLDPQERLFLETCWRVMERAGYLGPNLHDRLNSEVGVFAGSMSQQYHGVQTDPTRAALNLLSSPSSIANRVSYFFDLKGPSVAVDTMCSSSIVAIHMACDALRRGDCRAAIAGAVNVSLHPQKFVGLSAGGFSGTSPDSTSFSDGDGYLPSEAVGAVLLKPLAEAQADHDQILALIKSTAINHSGKSNGYRVPSIAAQIDLYTRNYEKSGIDPKTIGYVEAAANGSALGDSMELAALKRVFGKPASDQDMCALGSVKANIGHAEAASGISQLAKVILQMREACFVPTRINGELNPKLEFADTPFYLPDRVTAWPRPKDHPRRAAIHAIGAGGTNAHLILEDAPERVRPTHAPSGEQCLLPLSARSLAALRQMAGDLANHVAATPDLALEDVAHTLRYGRMDMEVRAAVVCSSMEELSAALSALAEDTTHHALHYASETTSDMRMVFSGETGRHMIATCIDQKDWEKIAQIWIAGARVDWSDLAQDGRCLVPLPGHPLQRLPYWLPETGQHSTQNAADPAGDETDAGGDLEGFFRRYLAKLLRIEMDQVNLNRGALDLGLDSVSILPICQEIEKRTGQSFGIRDTLAYETLAQLIADLDGLLRPQSPSIAEAADPVDRPLPLTQTQQALWLEDQRTPASPAYTVPVALRLKGRLDLEALQAACDEMPKRHQALGSVIRTYEGQPKRFILPDTGVPMKIHDLGHLSEAEATKEMQRLANVGFDLAQGALWRVHLARLGPDHHVLIGLVHHINFDGVSALNLARDLLDVYQAFASQQSPRPSSAAAFGAFVDWQVDMLAGDTGTKLRSHWRDALFDAPPPTRLPSHIAPLVPPDTPRGTVEFTISKADLHDLRRLASDACTTPASVLCTAYMATLARAFDLKDVTLAVPVLGRPSSRFAQSIGYFTNVVPLHCRLAHLETVRSQITHVANTLAIALDNSDLPLPEILAQGKQTAPRLAFAYQNLAPATDGAMPDGLAVSPVTELAQNGGHDLALEIYPQEDGLRCRFDYDACLIDIDAVRGLAEGLCTILRGMCAEATKAFADISFVPDDVEGRLMDEWGNGGPAATGPDLISSIFDHAKATPDATALIERSKQITFSELSDQIRALTGQLQRAGVKPGDHVATCLPKGALCVVSILATWAAGATHVPISMDLPGERQRILADQANVTACLVDRLHLAFDDTVVAQIKVDAAFSGAPGQMVAPDANRLAYVLFTSGTTGTPKGVAVSHTALQHHIHGVAEFYQLSQKDVVLNFADHSFDASIEQWLTPLTRGACVVVKTEALWSAQDACDAIRKNRITLAELPPAFLHEVLLTCAKTQDWDALDTLRAMITGAEAMRPDTIALWQESPLSSRSLFNLYGPTETTIGSTAYCLEPGVTLPSARLPIGRPLPGETAFVVDQYGHPVPVGVPGLLILGGVGLAEGYVNSKAATAQKFVANPVGGTDRLYLTGDIARWTPQGALEFLGRVDTQVSLNGHRVELGEIEKALSGIDGVTHAAVVASQNQEQTEIRAFCEVSKPGMTAASLRQNLQDLLPRYMVPAQVTIIDRLPRTASGKLDTNALRNEPRHAQDGDTPLGGQDDLTRSISDIWADILGVDRVPEHANLADLGMQSLGLIRFAGELYDTLGIRVQVAQLLSAPTVAAQTALITKATESGLICLNEGTDLTPLILIPCGLGSALTYAELMEHLPKNRPIYTMDYPGDADRSLEEVAGTYTKDLLKLGRPVHLVGWSAGGVLAWEIAHQLSEQSDRVAQVSLIDSYAPSVTQRYFADQDNTLAKGNLANFATEMGMTLPHPKTHITLEDIGAATGKDPTALASLFDTYCSMSSIVDAYDPPKATFPVVAFHVNHPNVADALDVWPMADGQTMKQVAVDGNHQTMLQNPNAKALAKAIWSTDV
ncbi:MAG: amino acid adenylation domain-containing protein [Pseudomonadota bacterium]